MSKNVRTVNLPADLYDRVAERAKDAGFETVDEYVTFVMAEVIRDDEIEEQQTYSEQDEEEVKKRLKALGYME